MSFPLTIATGKEYSHITHEEAVRIWNSAKLPESPSIFKSPVVHRPANW